jgi:hypothetical protein
VALRPSDRGPEALACLSADLLPGWYDDWVLSEAEDWRQLRLHALEALADRLTATGRWGEAADAAGAAVRAEPLRESANAALIRSTWPKVTSPRPSASSTATERCWTPSSGSSPPRACAAWCRTSGPATGNAGVALASRHVVTICRTVSAGEASMSENEVDDFESLLDNGAVGGGVTVEPGEVIDVVDGVEVRYIVDTSPRVADVVGQGIDDPPFGEEV